jgi:hypothetical protein
LQGSKAGVGRAGAYTSNDPEACQVPVLGLSTGNFAQCGLLRRLSAFAFPVV